MIIRHRTIHREVKGPSGSWDLNPRRLTLESILSNHQPCWFPLSAWLSFNICSAYSIFHLLESLLSNLVPRHPETCSNYLFLPGQSFSLAFLALDGQQSFHSNIPSYVVLLWSSTSVMFLFSPSAYISVSLCRILTLAVFFSSFSLTVVLFCAAVIL